MLITCLNHYRFRPFYILSLLLFYVGLHVLIITAIVIVIYTPQKILPDMFSYSWITDVFHLFQLLCIYLAGEWCIY